MLPEDTDGSLMTNGSGDPLVTLPEVAWAATEEATGFSQVHYWLVYDTLTIWMRCADAKRQAPTFYSIR